MKRARWWVGLAAGAIGVLACTNSVALGADESKDEKKGKLVGLDGLQSRTPADWKEEETSSRMRAFQFRLPKVKGDKDDAELVIFYFGPGGGGSTEDNVKRWKGMFVPPEGKKIDDVTKVDKMKVGTVDVTYVDLHGTYKFKKAPMVPDSEAELRPDQRMLAVVFESPKGPYFIRLVGPAKTVDSHKKGFDDWLKGFK